jgi:glycosyltransferase involved in cell wall biosynthesis
MEDKILVFIPMYNCEKQILRVLEQFKGEVINYISEIVIVNNRSTDNGEKAVIDKINDHGTVIPIKVLRNRDNYGLGGSHKVAFNYAIKNGFDYVIVLHGDDQGRIRDILPILKKGTYKKYDCCLGGRFMKKSKLPGYSKFRTFGNKVFNQIFSIAIGRRVYDLGAGLNLYSVDMLKSKYYMKYPDNLTFNCYMLFALDAYRQRNMFFPITWREEDQISNVKMTKQAVATLKMAVGYFFGGKRFLLRDARVNKVKKYQSDVVFEKEKNL